MFNFHSNPTWFYKYLFDYLIIDQIRLIQIIIWLLISLKWNLMFSTNNKKNIFHNEKSLFNFTKWGKILSERLLFLMHLDKYIFNIFFGKIWNFWRISREKQHAFKLKISLFHSIVKIADVLKSRLMPCYSKRL